MNKNYITVNLIFTLLLFIPTKSNSQEIYGLSPNEFAYLALTNSTYNIITPSIKLAGSTQGNSTFNPQQGHYIYRKGGPGAGIPDTICVIDVQTGNFISKDTIPQNHLGNPEFYQATNTIYGLSPNGFASLNLTNSTYGIINPSITLAGSVQGNSTFDEQNGNYIYKKGGPGAGIPDTIIVIDAQTGNFISKDTIPQNHLASPEFYQPTNTVYGLSPIGFASLNLTNSTYNIINPSITLFGSTQGNSTFNHQMGRYIYRKGGPGAGIPDTIIVIDVQTGNFISKDTISQNNLGNIEFHQNTTGIFNNEKSLDIYFKIYPNPIIDFITVKFRIEDNKKYTLNIYNSIGQLEQKIERISNGHVRIEKGDLTNGIYFFQLQTDNKTIGNRQVIVQ